VPERIEEARPRAVKEQVGCGAAHKMSEKNRGKGRGLRLREALEGPETRLRRRCCFFSVQGLAQVALPEEIWKS
jgi:hypothetical protein